jgi:hypothetical protein
MNRWQTAVVMVACMLWVGGARAQAQAEARSVQAAGKVVEVTLYRGQAQVVREVPVDGGAGGIELVVIDLPERIQPGSMFGEGGQGVQVRAVRHRTRAVGQAPTEQVAKLDQQITELEDDLALVEQHKQLLAKQSAYLDQLDKFVVPTANVELSKGVLDAEQLEALTRMSFEQRERIASRSIELRKQERELQQRRGLLQRQRAQLTSGHTRTVHEAVVFCEKQGGGKGTVRLTYIVDACGWSPTYNFRADTDKNQVAIEYNGLIRQMSGENWRNVKLTLSTATPRLSAAAPGLAPFRVALAQGADPNWQMSADRLRKQVRIIQDDNRNATRRQHAAVDLGTNLDANWRMNIGANDLQLLELSNGREKLAVLREEGGATETGPSLSYTMAQPVSVDSRQDQQMIRVMRQTLDATFYHSATPVLTRHVYREADVANDTDLDLLSGPVNMYLDGRFVGRMEIPTVARGQTFVVGFGADPQLAAARELVERHEATQGGNQVVSFEYRLVVENYRDQKVPVRVYDRLPYTDDSKDLRVTLGEMSDKLSDHKIYLRIDRPKGILRWDIEAPANASGADARFVKYAYRLEYARDYHLANPLRMSQGKNQAPGALQEEFNQLQMQRYVR